jgi:hypothetical protein
MAAFFSGRVSDAGPSTSGRSGSGPASESLRRTNPRESGECLPGKTGSRSRPHLARDKSGGGAKHRIDYVIMDTRLRLFELIYGPSDRDRPTRTGRVRGAEEESLNHGGSRAEMYMGDVDNLSIPLGGGARGKLQGWIRTRPALQTRPPWRRCTMKSSTHGHRAQVDHSRIRTGSRGRHQARLRRLAAGVVAACAFRFRPPGTGGKRAGWRPSVRRHGSRHVMARCCAEVYARDKSGRSVGLAHSHRYTRYLQAEVIGLHVKLAAKQHR